MAGSVGRERERELLSQAAEVKQASLVAIYGRRRVGKTHLVRTHLRPMASAYFETIGQHEASRDEQLENFRRSLEKTFFQGRRLPTLGGWRDAMDVLATEIELVAKRLPRSPVVVFFDELPWMSTHRSGLLSAMDHAWNSRLSQVPNLVWVLCGSAASFMLDKLVNARGGLHNRLTHRIRLDPFRLPEARDLLASLGLRRNTNQLLDLYMALGGVPYYLQQVRKGRSAAQAIGELAFGTAAPLRDEFDRLFKSLFDESQEHEALVRAAATRRGGLTRNELTHAAGVQSGGRVSKHLSELEAAGFLAKFTPYGKKSRDTSYRLVDEYSLFFLRWIDSAPVNAFGRGGVKYWLSKSQDQSYAAWAGYAFESLCAKHTPEIERALGIESMANVGGSWRYVPARGSPDHGAQVDWLFDRPDGVINLCELKFLSEPFVLTKSYAKELVTKAEVFQARTKTKKEVRITLVTPYGLRPGLWNDEVVDSVVTVEDLLRS